MSIKTLRKRIALVAVSALGVGLLSVAPASAVAIAGTAGDTLFLGTTRDGDGTANAASGFTTSSTSVGWITDTSATTSTTDGGVFARAGAIRSGVVYQNAQIAFTATGTKAAANGLTVVVTGGTMSQLAASAGAAVTLSSTHVNGNSTVITIDEASSDDRQIYGVFNISAAVGSVATISVYTGASITALTSATAGTLQGQYQLTVASASAAGAYSAADSTVTQQTCLATGDTAGTTAYDITSRCRNGYVGAIYVDLEDAYGSELTGGTISATASNSALITYSATASTGSTVNGATSSFTSVASDGEIWLYVKQPTANTAGTSVVTISWNGTVVGTKTINWAGDIATLVVDTANSNSIFSTNQGDDTANIGAAGVIYVAKDAAGNAVTLSSQPSVFAATGALIGATTSATTVATFAALQTSSVGYGYTMLVIPANSLSGAGTYQLYVTNAQGATIKSQEVKVTVSRGSTDSFAVSWDKTTYNPGDIATLTISAKDAYGNAIADGTTLAGLALTVNTAGFASVGTACATSSTFLGGVKKCTFAALNDAGSYAYSVDVTTGTPQSAIVGTLGIAPKVSAVSNAEVLAAIVKLIASINKQIVALQKLLTKKK